MTRAQQYLAMARDYARSAMVLAGDDGQAEVGLSFYAVAGQAYELALKAALSHHGEREEFLMLIGHRLSSCYERAIKGGLTGADDRATRDTIEMLDGPFEMQAFRYPMTALHVTTPDARTVVYSMTALLAAVAERIGDAP